ncbi:hypothetical protein BpHYR1_007053 [Brachionus plicatilis]|uniref:Uncharacterized protein n=1 Tax=Brachionus plicatilis TaxID=10195 RepID=A0A3M7QYN4_BRAPC|nr:hypothetical protein BpHYR1_007053 [Brachionus plicatilis]
MTELQDSELNLRPIQQYETGESEADDQEILPGTKQKKNWIIAKTFESANQVTEWLKKIQHGHTRGHTKQKLEQRKSTVVININESTKHEIQRLLAQNPLYITPKVIQTTLAELTKSNQEINVPTNKQPTTSKESNKNVPIDNDQPFVVSYQIKIDNDEDGTIQFQEDYNISIRSLSFRIFLSTTRLMSMISVVKYIQADLTYMLIWNNFPVQIVAFTDVDHSFHPIGLRITTYENENDYNFNFNSIQFGSKRTGSIELANVALLADAADSITNGFKSTFYPTTNNFKPAMCWFQMKKAVHHQLNEIKDKKLQDSIMRDIVSLHFSISDDEIFSKASELFKENQTSQSTSYFTNTSKINEPFNNQTIKNYCITFNTNANEFNWINEGKCNMNLEKKRNRGRPFNTRNALEMQFRDDRLTTVSTSQKRLASPVESVNKRSRMSENVDEILEVEDEISQTRSKANNLIKSTSI